MTTDETAEIIRLAGLMRQADSNPEARAQFQRVAAHICQDDFLLVILAYYLGRGKGYQINTDRPELVRRAYAVTVAVGGFVCRYGEERGDSLIEVLPCWPLPEGIGHCERIH